MITPLPPQTLSPRPACCKLHKERALICRTKPGPLFRCCRSQACGFDSSNHWLFCHFNCSVLFFPGFDRFVANMHCSVLKYQKCWGWWYFYMNPCKVKLIPSAKRASPLSHRSMQRPWRWPARRRTASRPVVGGLNQGMGGFRCVKPSPLKPSPVGYPWLIFSWCEKVIQIELIYVDIRMIMIFLWS